MSRFGLRSALLSATLFLPTILCAQSETMTPPAADSKSGSKTPAPAAKASDAAAMRANRAADTLKRFDKNGDGKIDDDERADAQESMLKERVDRQLKAAAVTPGGGEQLRARLLELFDKNKDGQLDDDERAEAEKAAKDRAASPAVVAAREEFMKRFDKNSDGKIEGDERAAVKEFLAERPLPVPGLKAPEARTRGVVLREDLIKRVDRNKDGKIDEKEFVELAPSLRPGLEIAAARGDALDANRDGKLDDAEWNEAQKHLFGWLSGESALGASLSPQDEQRRLQAVAAEVARRREARELAGGVIGEVMNSPAAEKMSPERKQAAADEIVRRRELRLKAQVETDKAKTDATTAEKDKAAK